MKADHLYSSSVQAHSEAVARQRRELEIELKNDIRSIAGTPAGRRFLWWLLSITGPHLPSYTGNSDTYFNEGRRAVGLEIEHRLVAADPAAYLAMIQEGVPEET